ncbi:transporter substrate-binding domain-containing protein [Mesorhizobium sp. SP-1A]|uniref:transporter substrate-binding domain-containing protein n=1 Tax=Mesorhizobium sp. SP-1A TaxID=3077840 RepID=UPI0028F7490E|nr:transporter substrate-binding domain-containing protein [Mesorhizobium sp. SP-1A]
MKSAIRMCASALLTATLSLGAIGFACAADLLEQVKQKGEIVIGTEARYPPFEFVENGKIVGYNIDLFDAVMKGLPDVKVERLDLPFQGLLPGLQALKFDAIVTSVAVNKKRYETYRLSLPVADATLTFVKRKGDDTLQKAEDLSGRTIGSQAGSAQLKGAQDLSSELEAKGKAPIKSIQTYLDYNEAYADLAAGRIDAVVNALPNLLYLQSQRGDVFETVTTTFGPASYFSWAFRKDEDSKPLADFIDSRIRSLAEDGTVKKLQEKWFGSTIALPTDVLPEPQS